jgi:adenosine deaminase CECR1
MWDSTMTDDFYVAVTEFNLSWDEVKQLSRNSLAHAFVTPDLKQELLAKYDSDISRFERQMSRSGLAKLGPMPETRSFICKRYELCF